MYTLSEKVKINNSYFSLLWLCDPCIPRSSIFHSCWKTCSFI